MQEFGERFEEEYHRQTRPKAKPVTTKKRGAAASSADDTKLAKRPKTEPSSQSTADGGGGMTDEEMAALNDKGSVSKVNNPLMFTSWQLCGLY